MSNQKDNAIRKINAMRKLTKENGATEAEALLALDKVNQLLEQYNIDLTEVDIDQSKCKWIEYSLESKKTHPVVHVAGAVAQLTHTKCLLSTTIRTKQKYVQFFGLEQDIMFAGYLVEIIHKAMESEYKIFFKQYKKSYEYKNRKAFHINAIKSSFQIGMAYRLVLRINELIAQQKSNVSQATGTSLIVLKHQVVDEEFAKQFDKDSKPKTTVKAPSIKGSAVMKAGFEAGDKVPLNRAVTEESDQDINKLQN